MAGTERLAPLVGKAVSMGAAYVTAKVADKAWNKGKEALVEAVATSQVVPRT